jgi:hypothetical protein
MNEHDIADGWVIEMNAKQIRQYDRDYRKWLIKNGKLKPKLFRRS